MELGPLLAIRCTTYNHEPYIRQCLEGFVMQKTNFPFIAIVHDDASTDGTADIIREFEEKYPDIIKPIYETENQWSKGKGGHQKAIDLVMPEGVKYIAMCEGDDYWIDPNKLQMQVDFLEENPEYGMCYGKAKVWNQQKQKFVKPEWGRKVESFYAYLQFGSSEIPTASVVMRHELYKKYYKDVKPTTRHWKVGDHPMWLWFLYNSKIKFIDRYITVYRILENSASHFKNVDTYIVFWKSLYDIKKFYVEKYGLNYNVVFDENLRRARWFLYRNKRKEALIEFKKCDNLNRKNKVYVFLCKNPALFLFVRLRNLLIQSGLRLHTKKNVSSSGKEIVSV